MFVANETTVLSLSLFAFFMCTCDDAELINVGQKQEALEVLHSFITSRWFIAWTKTHERLLLKYVDLCLDMKRGRHAKDGLIQYHDSLEEARDIDDLEADRRLEDLSIGKSKVNGIDAQILN
ncbi:hypothetical protein CDL12_08447 [Handroanthus impetiginosus]|uniref:eIF3a PCI domain-containing protein n=1 Tax=Handroanthus impetiginosus TaxID=429701 RepID=A0A2G9HMZ5_9LAMI|nr:hypothetical protein CDL12_08447 [Handroanthus impetiginosus]